MHVWMTHQASGRVQAHGRASAFSSLPIVIDLEPYSPVTLRQNSALSIEWQFIDCGIHSFEAANEWRLFKTMT